MILARFGYRPHPEPLALARAYRPHLEISRLDPSVTIDLTPLAPHWRDQGDAPTCTGFAGRGAVLGLMEAARRDLAWRGDLFDLSPRAIYHRELQRDGRLSPAAEEGATIEELLAVLRESLPREDRCPYDPGRLFEPVPEDAWTAHCLVNATHLRHDLDEIRAAMADGCPLLAGIPCYEGERGILSAWAAEHGDVAMPARGDELVAWHAVSIWRHDPANRVFEFQNSWSGFRMAANCMGTLPEEYILVLGNEVAALGAVR